MIYSSRCSTGMHYRTRMCIPVLGSCLGSSVQEKICKVKCRSILCWYSHMHTFILSQREYIFRVVYIYIDIIIYINKQHAFFHVYNTTRIIVRYYYIYYSFILYIVYNILWDIYLKNYSEIITSIVKF